MSVDLTEVRIDDLVEEIGRRCKCFVVAAQLLSDHCHPECNTRFFMGVRHPSTPLELLGLANMAHQHVADTTKAALCGPPNAFEHGEPA